MDEDNWSTKGPQKQSGETVGRHFPGSFILRIPDSGTPNKLSCLAEKFFVLCTVHTHTHTHTNVFVTHKCQRVILDEFDSDDKL